MVIGLYLLGVLIIGYFAQRYTRLTFEDYHLASRSFKTLILFCSVLGTNISAVALVGAPGQAYHVGWVTWAYYASCWAWLSPLLFYTLGSRIWLLGKTYGYATQSDIVVARWNSSLLGLLVVFLLYFILFLISW